MQYIVKCPNGQRWKVREAVSLKAALNSIAHAMVTGSIGDSVYVTTIPQGGSFSDRVKKCIASVIKINSDGTECQPYTPAY